jgi:hypothetical protein
MRIEGLYLERAAVRLRKQSYAAVGHGSVNVHQQQGDLRGPLPKRGRDFC